MVCSSRKMLSWTGRDIRSDSTDGTAHQLAAEIGNECIHKWIIMHGLFSLALTLGALGLTDGMDCFITRLRIVNIQFYRGPEMFGQNRTQTRPGGGLTQCSNTHPQPNAGALGAQPLTLMRKLGDQPRQRQLLHQT